MSRLSIAVPPLSEQQKIVEYLNEATFDIETSIVYTRRQIELVQEYRTRLIADVVTGKVDVREAAARLPEEEEEPDPMDEEGVLPDNTEDDSYHGDEPDEVS